MRERIRIDALQLFEFAILNNQSRQLVRLGQLFEHCLAGGDATGGGLAARNYVQRFKALSYLLRELILNSRPASVQILVVIFCNSAPRWRDNSESTSVSTQIPACSIR